MAASLADRYLSEAEREEIEARIRYMDETDMAVIVSQSQNEIPEMADKGLDIVPHRRRMATEDMDEKFKILDDPFQDRLRLRHVDDRLRRAVLLDDLPRQADEKATLMQTIARANRVFPGKR
ncbi:MAG: hypothetical protein R3A46_15410 [Thermomicrobiales bacterium]